MEDVEGSQRLSESFAVFLYLTRLLTSSWQADRLESQMRELLKIQEEMDVCLDQRDEELRQLHSQSQSDGAQLAALSLQMQELISSVESRAEVVGKDLEEINGQFDCHRGEINHLKIREKNSKQEVECQEIGLVALMFFFELLFLYVSLTISFYVFLTSLFSLIPSLIC